MIKDHLGNLYQTKNDMCKAYNKTVPQVNGRLRIGWSLKKALTTDMYITYVTYEDHLGKVYSSFTKMCESYGLKSACVRERLKKGFSLEEALTTDLYYCDTFITEDHLGNKFNSVTEKCKHYNIKRGLYYRQKRKGLTDIDIFSAV